MCGGRDWGVTGEIGWGVTGEIGWGVAEIEWGGEHWSWRGKQRGEGKYERKMRILDCSETDQK